MNNQKVFNKVISHLRKQNSKSLTIDDRGYSTCLYRDKLNRSCAVGCLIEDWEYQKEMEGKGIFTIKRLFPNLTLFSNFDADYSDNYYNCMELLKSLQLLHDLTTISNWENGFKDIAKKFKLKLEKLNNE